MLTFPFSRNVIIYSFSNNAHIIIILFETEIQGFKVIYQRVPSILLEAVPFTSGSPDATIFIVVT